LSKNRTIPNNYISTDIEEVEAEDQMLEYGEDLIENPEDGEVVLRDMDTEHLNPVRIEAESEVIETSPIVIDENNNYLRRSQFDISKYYLVFFSIFWIFFFLIQYFLLLGKTLDFANTPIASFQNPKNIVEIENIHLDFPTFSNISPTSQTSNDSPTSNETSLPGTSQMLNNVDGASPEKTKKRKRRTQAEILQDFKKKLAEANKNNKTMTKELLEEKKMEKLEKKMSDSAKKRQGKQ
jgi:hypothetical protein